ncbi:MAG: gamma-glutamyltransferase [Gammaproteobacteria bacterium]|nr:gamma-glutamyltransferase [Gammaproteobacteria bacterium]
MTSIESDMRRQRPAAALALFAVVVCTALPSYGSQEASGREGAVASRSPLATQVGIGVLRQGGNAIDAAVAMGFALAVTHPSAGNIGGGGFMVIRLADGELVANDHREKAPLEARRDMFQDDNGAIVEGLSTASHLAVGVPGTVDGLLDVLRRHGTLTRQQIIAPALALARDGFSLPTDLAAQFERLGGRFEPYPASLAKFTRDDGSPLAAGDVFRQPDLAATLARIAEHGRAGFYEGATADLIVTEMARGGGLISHRDLAEYRSVWREPVRGTYRGHEIVSMPPPSSGGALLIQMLNMLEPYDLASLGRGSPPTVHLMVEAERRAYADRAEYLGDADFYDVPLARLMDKDYARSRFADFDPDAASRSADIGAGTWPTESPETTHVSVMDAHGNAVAYTTTLNLGYGSKIVVTGAGFLLNNEMDDFSSKPGVPNSFGLVGGEANAIEPGKRMLSSMTPTLVLKGGEPVLVTGSPGGSTIITTVLQVVTNVIDHGMDVGTAVATPRFHHQWLPNQVRYEPGAVAADTRTSLEKIGHVGFRETPGIGDANSVMRVGDEITARSDPRNAGAAAAY